MQTDKSNRQTTPGTKSCEEPATPTATDDQQSKHQHKLTISNATTPTYTDHQPEYAT
jgi:hypothetical protein